MRIQFPMRVPRIVATRARHLVKIMGHHYGVYVEIKQDVGLFFVLLTVTATASGAGPLDKEAIEAFYNFMKRTYPRAMDGGL